MKKIFGLAIVVISLFAIVGAYAPSQIMLAPRTASAELNDTDFQSLISVRNSPHSPYAFITYDGDGKFVITVEVDHGTYTRSINPFSENYFDQTIDIFNQGLEAYNIIISSNNPRIQFYPAQTWTADKGRSLKAQTLSSPSMVSAGNRWNIGLFVDASGKPTGSTITATITVTATNP